MGYYKNIDTELQAAEELAMDRNDAKLADTLAWYRAHYDTIPPELLSAILADNEFFEKALTVWDNANFAPKPASAHVALQVSRRELRPPRKSWRCIIGWSMIGLSITASVIILVVNI